MTTPLNDRIQTLEQRLQQLKVRQQRLDARQRALTSRRARKADTRRKILVGSFVLDRLAQAGKAPIDLENGGVKFRDWLVREGDRAVFNLPPKA